jgi:hypothetical protein
MERKKSGGERKTKAGGGESRGGASGEDKQGARGVSSDGLDRTDLGEADAVLGCTEGREMRRLNALLICASALAGVVVQRTTSWVVDFVVAVGIHFSSLLFSPRAFWTSHADSPWQSAIVRRNEGTDRYER